MNAGPQPLTAGTDAPAEVDPAAPPYPGLRSFGPADEPFYFGRADTLGTAVRRFWEALDEPERSAWMWVVGPSGSGKTSLLHAGLCPRLDTVGYDHVSLTPGADPMGALATALAGRLDVDPVDAVAGLGGEPARWLAGQRRSGGGADTELVLVVDGFEDVFRLSPPDQSRQFVDTLLSLSAPGRAARCVVVAGLDIAYYPQAADDPGLAASLPDAQVLVAPLRDEQLRVAVVEPARAAGYVVEDDLADLLLADAAAHEAAVSAAGTAAPTLPLVAQALRQTWRRATGRTLTAAGYREAGGLDGVVEATAEAVWADLDSGQRKLAGRLIGLLAEPRGDTLVPVTLPASELATVGDRVAVDRVVDRFVEAGLLTAGESGVAVGHAALLSAWSRVGTLARDQSARDHTGRRRGRDTGSLSPSSPGAAPDAATPAGPPATAPAGPTVGQRLEAVRQARQERRRERRERRERATAGPPGGSSRLPWLVVAVAAVVALGAVGVAVMAGNDRQDAEVERDGALARETASTAGDLRADEPALGAEVAVAGHAVADTVESRSAVLDAAGGPVPARYLGGAGPAVVAVATDTDLVAVGDGSDATVQIFTGGSEGNDLSRDGLVDLRDVPDPPDPAAGADAGPELASVALTPDGDLLVTGDSIGRVALWDLSDRDAPELLAGPLEGPEGPTGPVHDIAVSPESSEMAVAADSGPLLRWSLEDPTDPQPLPPVSTLAAPSSVTYGFGLPVMAVGTAAGTVQVWNLADGPDLIEDRAPGESPVRSVAFAPEGSAMAAAGADGELYLWDVSDGFAGAGRIDIDDATFDEAVTSVAFSPDGRHVVAGGGDQSLRVWSTDGGPSRAELTHAATVTGTSFTGDGRLLSTAGDGTTQVWDLDRAVPFQVRGRVGSMAATGDGERLAVASTVEARVWQVDADGPAGADGSADLLARVDDDIEGVGDLTGAVDLSPSGDLLALGVEGADGVHLVEVGTGDGPDLLATAAPEVPEAPEGDEGAWAEGDDVAEPGAVAVALSPAGQVAAAGRDGQVHLWDVRSADEPVFLGTAADATEEIRDLTWGPGGDLLAVTSADGRIYLYGAGSGELDLTAAFDGVAADDGSDREDGEGRPADDAGPRATVFTGDGDRLVTVGVAGDGEAHGRGVLLVWGLDDPSDPRLVAGPVPGPTDVPVDVALGPADELVVAASLDGTAWVWDLSGLEDGDGGLSDPWLVLGTGDGPLRAVAFGPEGEVLRAGRNDGQVGAWPLVPEDAAAEICDRAGDPLTSGEWAAHLPGLEYEPPC